MKLVELTALIEAVAIAILLLRLFQLRAHLRRLNEQITASVVEAYETGLTKSEEEGRKILDGKNLDERVDAINDLIRKRLRRGT
jgi:DNA-binding transcriptional ArsR family regulator